MATKFAEASLGMHFRVAQGEVENTRGRVRAAKADALKKGKYRGGRRPYGFQDNGVKVIESEAKVIRYATKAINSGRWFSSLSPSLKHDILRCAYVKRYKDGDLITARGEPPEEWIACAKGAVRVSSTSISGKQITLTYVEPGIWFGDVSIFDGDRRTHDAYAHGDTGYLATTEYSSFVYAAALGCDTAEVGLVFAAQALMNTFNLTAIPWPLVRNALSLTYTMSLTVSTPRTVMA